MNHPISRPKRRRRAPLAAPVLVLAVLAALLVVGPASSARALCVALPYDGSFEQQRTSFVSAPWTAEGRAGIDIRKGYSRSVFNNAWARNTTGWNAIRQTVRLSAGRLYTLKAYVRTSANVRDDYFGFRNWYQRPVAQIKFGPLSSYRELRVQLPPRVDDVVPDLRRLLGAEPGLVDPDRQRPAGVLLRGRRSEPRRRVATGRPRAQPDLTSRLTRTRAVSGD